MGLLDVLNGMRNGPGGQPNSSSRGGMSPITMAILALLAYKGLKHLGGGQAPAAPGTNPSRIPGGNPMDAGAPNGGGLGGLLGGGLGDLLKRGLGGLFAGGAAGGILSGGLGGLLQQFQQNGQGQVANSWVGKGPNQSISESDLAKSIGIDDIESLTQHTGLSRDELLSGLSKELPEAIDELTPDGRLPTEQELSQRV
jgi:uncharacterized protein YidB (DUF937 family)